MYVRCFTGSCSIPCRTVRKHFEIPTSISDIERTLDYRYLFLFFKSTGIERLYSFQIHCTGRRSDDRTNKDHLKLHSNGYISPFSAHTDLKSSLVCSSFIKANVKESALVDRVI